MAIMLKHARIVVVLLALGLGSTEAARAACVPADLPTPPPRDPVARVLAQQSTCPATAIAFRNLLKKAGARLEPTMVNFVGFHNPDAGAFFVFEIASAPAGVGSAIQSSAAIWCSGTSRMPPATDGSCPTHRTW